MSNAMNLYYNWVKYLMTWSCLNTTLYTESSKVHNLRIIAIKEIHTLIFCALLCEHLCSWGETTVSCDVITQTATSNLKAKFWSTIWRCQTIWYTKIAVVSVVNEMGQERYEKRLSYPDLALAKIASTVLISYPTWILLSVLAVYSILWDWKLNDPTPKSFCGQSVSFIIMKAVTWRVLED